LGIAYWIAPEGVLRLFGETLPNPPLYMRIFGATQIGLVFLYWFAYQNPIKNRDMIRYAVIDNTIAFLTLMGYAATVGITNPLGWLSAGLLFFFTIAFYVLTPKVS
jgi:hypothetical protein